MRRRIKPVQILPAPKQGATFETLLDLIDRLEAVGVKRLGEWWLDALAEWYSSPTARTLGICAGRGSAKSHALYIVALNETLFGDFDVPVGERHSANLTSRLKEEASKGTAILSQWLTRLKIRHTPTDGLIELADMPRDIRITAASIAANSGWRSFFDGNDETGKWPSEGSLAVDASEVLASKAGMCATHPNARRMIVSTPLLDSGAFHDLVTAGTNADQVVRCAPTWIATDGRITEEQTRRLERNARRHAREFGAVFGTEWEHGFFSGLVEGCVVTESDEYGWAPVEGVSYAMAIDPAFARDQFAICIAHHEENGLVVVDLARIVDKPKGAEKLTPTLALKDARDRAEEYGVQLVWSDQFAFAALAEIAATLGFYLDEEPWSAANKGPLFTLTQTLMRDDKLRLPNHPALRRQLAGIATRLLPSGHEQITARPGFADDLVSAMVMAVHKASQMSPRIARRRKEGEPPAAFVVRGTGSRYAADDDDDLRGLPPTAENIRVTDANGDRRHYDRRGRGGRGGRGGGGFGDFC